MVSYLARYANRVVIANDRLIKIEHGEVFFSYKDYRDDNRRKVHHLPNQSQTKPGTQLLMRPRRWQGGGLEEWGALESLGRVTEAGFKQGSRPPACGGWARGATQPSADGRKKEGNGRGPEQGVDLLIGRFPHPLASAKLRPAIFQRTASSSCDQLSAMSGRVRRMW